MPADSKLTLSMSQPLSHGAYRSCKGTQTATLVDYPDGCFDYVILSQTLQTTRRPDLVLDHMLRIGKQAFVSFPNFAQWRIRMAHMFGGQMPVTEQLPHRWYDTPNIHHVTIDDFRSFLKGPRCGDRGQWFLSGQQATQTGAGQSDGGTCSFPASPGIAERYAKSRTLLLNGRCRQFDSRTFDTGLSAILNI